MSNIQFGSTGAAISARNSPMLAAPDFAAASAGWPSQNAGLGATSPLEFTFQDELLGEVLSAVKDSAESNLEAMYLA
jgi:hypothetical protein